MQVNRGELADVFGVASPTIDRWVGEGLPYVTRGGRGQVWAFDTAAAIAWWAEHQSPRRRDRRTVANRGAGPEVDGDVESIEEAERRKMVAQADRAEADLAKVTGLLVPIDEVAAVVLEEHTRVRTHLLAIPNAVRARVQAHFGANRAAAEQVVSEVEAAILEAMSEIRGPGMDGPEAGA